MPRRRRRRDHTPPSRAPRLPPSPVPAPAPPTPGAPSPPPAPPPRSDSLRLSAEDMVVFANGGMRTPSGALAHFLAAYTPAELSLARSDYLQPPLSPNHYLSPNVTVQPRSSLSLRADSADVDNSNECLKPKMPHQSYSYSVHTLRRQHRVKSPEYDWFQPHRCDRSRVKSPDYDWVAKPECDCLPTDPIPPPELFDF